MTSSTLEITPRAIRGAVSNADTTTDQNAAPRPGSRVDRMAMPLAREVLKAMAEHHGVCVHPLVIRRTDRHTGVTDLVDVPCGARLASKCKPCAERNRRARIQQLREGWHLADEPQPPPDAPDNEIRALVSLRCSYTFERDQAQRNSEWEQVADLDAAIGEVDELLATKRIRGHLDKPATAKRPRRVRSTRRRQDAGQLPRRLVEPRTVGPVYTARGGRAYQPSSLLTVTLGSYGPVHTGARTRRGHLTPANAASCTGNETHCSASRSTPPTTITARLPWTLSSSPPDSTGSGRIYAAPPAGTCSTAVPSRCRSGSPRTPTTPCAAPSRAPYCARSQPAPTTKSGGPTSTGHSTQ